MDEAQARVLDMLGAGKIDADQAARLLEALQAGSAPPPVPTETLEKLGKLVQRHGKWQWHWDHGERGQPGEAIDHPEEGFEVPPGGSLCVRVKGSNLQVARQTEGRTASVTSHGRRPVRVTRAGDTFHVTAGKQTGNVILRTPPLDRLEVVLTGGNASLENVAEELEAKVTGGNLRAEGCRCRLNAKCTGGAVHVRGELSGIELKVTGGNATLDGLRLTEGRHGIKVTGGNVTVALSPESSVRVRTKATQGEAVVDGALAAEGTEGEYVIGDGDALLDVKVTGGSVTLHRAARAEEEH